MLKNMNPVTVIALGILAVLIAIVLLVPTPAMAVKLRDFDANGLTLPSGAYEQIPEEIKQNASKVALDFYGEKPEIVADFTNQLLAAYWMAKDKDFLTIFNPGGWGWASIQDSSGWDSIAEGINSHLAENGYESLVLDYQRTNNGMNGYLCELTAYFSNYVGKADHLANVIDFITGYLPDLKVIITGESNGAAFGEKVFRKLKDNPQVYGILTGPPVWSNELKNERSLVIRSNGEVPDAFSNGDVFTMIRANLEGLFGISPQNEGNILLYIGAPGHVYSWDYPLLRAEITAFVDENFINP